MNPNDKYFETEISVENHIRPLRNSYIDSVTGKSMSLSDGIEPKSYSVIEPSNLVPGSMVIALK